MGSELELDIALMELVANGLIEVEWSEECQDLTVRITDKGRAAVGDDLNDFL
jgi:DNA-binding PadR family transcriptional regulator